MRRKKLKKEASKGKQTNKAKQHSTPKAVTFPRKNELPQHVHNIPAVAIAMYMCLQHAINYIPVINVTALLRTKVM